MSRRRLVLLLAFAAPLAADGVLLYRDSVRSVAATLLPGDLAVGALVACYAIVGGLLWMKDRGMVPFLAVSYSVIVLFLLAESVLRAAYPLPPARVPTPPMHLRSPAVSPEVMPGMSGPGELAIREFSVNRLGLRAPESDPRAADLRILCLGGGPTQNYFITDHKTWPWKLQEILEQETGRRVFVGNAGYPGHTAANHARMIRDYAPTSEFDWVVVLCGWCDLRLTLAGIYDEWIVEVPTNTLRPNPQRTAWDKTPYYRRTQAVRMLESLWETGEPRPWLGTADRSEGLLDDGGEHHLEDRRKMKLGLAERPIRSVPQELPVAVERYRRDFREVIHAARERGVRLVAATQPFLHHEDMPPELLDLLTDAYPHGAYDPAVVAHCMRAFNQALKDLCAVENVECIDLAAMVPQDPRYFMGGIGATIEGNVRMAERIAPFFVERLEPAGDRRGR